MLRTFQMPLVHVMRFIVFTEATRERAFNLVGQAFSSINADDFAAYVGLPVNEAIQGIFSII